MKNIDHVMAILDKCAKNKVKSFAIDESEFKIKIDFFEDQKTYELSGEMGVPNVENENAHLDIDKNAFEKIQMAEEIEDDYDLLALENPLQFENLLAQDKLADFGEENAQYND